MRFHQIDYSVLSSNRKKPTLFLEAPSTVTLRQFSYLFASKISGFRADVLCSTIASNARIFAHDGALNSRALELSKALLESISR